ncbi:sulfide/dihydroorotate dehydrogenase-like FAD/NAD-binding protein [Methanospirillum lacunae]|uniref:Dihydroorotate dehydrogenase n=1 Tax=Methanospirillum lacunae TaxID=668570 RepID=A0A2V2N302_9EURY|nr:sulfide/dihydroorotate dehydrogenase-like FAD/NAD-binding protein [Methanospirillum lacunae]PWR74159.1 dihydroorotate dehydrogenase [Methanospirillum lacunae]
MYTIEKSNEIADKIFEIWVDAPHVARNAQAGQFVIIRIDETGERIPLTISRARGDLVRIVFMAVGKTTHALAAIKPGGNIADIVGPLGHPSEVKSWGTCVIVGGGAGISSTPCIAEALKKAGNKVIGIIGARNAGMLIFEDEMREICDELHVTTDDGSKGRHGFAADVLKETVADQKIDAVWIIGPAIMMKITSMATRDKGIKTFVSLNPIMVDGTGMCGSCRCQVAGKTVFACVDGPEFDAHEVDFDLLMQRQRYYMEQEKEAIALWNQHGCSCAEGK